MGHDLTCRLAAVLNDLPNAELHRDTIDNVDLCSECSLLEYPNVRSWG